MGQGGIYQRLHELQFEDAGAGWIYERAQHDRFRPDAQDHAAGRDRGQPEERQSTRPGPAFPPAPRAGCRSRTTSAPWSRTASRAATCRCSVTLVRTGGDAASLNRPLLAAYLARLSRGRRAVRTAGPAARSQCGPARPRHAGRGRRARSWARNSPRRCWKRSARPWPR